MRGDKHVFLVQILQQNGQGLAYLLIVIVGVTFLEEGLIWPWVLACGLAWLHPRLSLSLNLTERYACRE
jgi:hypothetical protein